MNHKQAPKKLNERHRVMMRLMLTGVTVGEAAEIVGLTLNRASVVANSELFKRELIMLRTEIEDSFIKKESGVGLDIKELLEKEVIPSFERIVQLRDGAEGEKNRLSAAQDLLDRAGVKSTEKLEVETKIVGSPALQNMAALAVAEMRKKKKKNEDS